MHGGRARRRAPRRRWLRTLLWLLVVPGALLVIAGAVTFFYFFVSVPLPSDIGGGPTVLLDATGQEFATLTSEFQREDVALDRPRPGHRARRAGGRGRRLLRAPRCERHRDPARALGQRDVGGDHAAAGRRSRSSTSRCTPPTTSEPAAQDPRGRARAEAGARVHQGPDPRVLSELRVLRPGRVRHPGRRTGLLRGRRRGAADRPGRAAGGRAAGALQLRPGGEPGGRAGALRLRAHPHGRGVLVGPRRGLCAEQRPAGVGGRERRGRRRSRAVVRRPRAARARARARGRRRVRPHGADHAEPRGAGPRGRRVRRGVPAGGAHRRAGRRSTLRRVRWSRSSGARTTKPTRSTSRWRSASRGRRSSPSR